MENIKEKKFKIAKETLEKAINELQKEYGINHYEELEKETLTNMSEEEINKLAPEEIDRLFDEIFNEK